MKSIDGVVKWGIVGCGDVCEVKSGPAFNKVNHSNLVAVMRRDLSKAEDFAKRHNVPRFYSDASSLINDKEVNAIYIATPPIFHEEYLQEALLAGKPVYVEKPVTVNAASCERMIDFAEKCNGHVSVAHYRRGLPLFIKVKLMILDGAIGNVRLVRLTTLQPKSNSVIPKTETPWRINPELSGGGLFHDLSPHQLDILYWIFGAPFKVSGRSLNQSHHYDAPDVTIMDAEFSNSVCLQGIWSFNVPDCAAEDSCEIIGDKAKLRFSFFKKSTLEVITNSGSENISFDYPVNIQQPMIEAVTNFFRGQGSNPCSLEEALVTMRMMDITLQ